MDWWSLPSSRYIDSCPPFLPAVQVKRTYRKKSRVMDKYSPAVLRHTLWNQVWLACVLLDSKLMGGENAKIVPQISKIWAELSPISCRCGLSKAESASRMSPVTPRWIRTQIEAHALPQFSHYSHYSHPQLGPGNREKRRSQLASSTLSGSRTCPGPFCPPADVQYKSTFRYTYLTAHGGRIVKIVCFRIEF